MAISDYRKYRVDIWVGRGLQVRRMTEVSLGRNVQEALGAAIIHLRAVDPRLEIRMDGISIQACDDKENPPS